VFSSEDLEQEHNPAGRLPHEQVSPERSFSTLALSQSHSPADFLPQEQVASAAHAQSPEAVLRPQQVDGAMMTSVGI